MDEVVAPEAVDRRILRAPQQDGRATNDVIAQQVALSTSAVWQRVKRLDEAGIVLGLVGLLAAERVGLPLMAYLSVRPERHSVRHKPWLPAKTRLSPAGRARCRPSAAS